MADNQENFGGTRLVGEDGEQMDPAIAGISQPSIPSLESDATDATAGADSSGEADVTASGAE